MYVFYVSSSFSEAHLYVSYVFGRAPGSPDSAILSRRVGPPPKNPRPEDSDGWGVHLYVCNVSWKLWEAHLYVFYVSGRLSGARGSNQPMRWGGSAKERPSRAWGERRGRLDLSCFTRV